jgi:hypothetical protein
MGSAIRKFIYHAPENEKARLNVLVARSFTTVALSASWRTVLSTMSPHQLVSLRVLVKRVRNILS